MPCSHTFKTEVRFLFWFISQAMCSLCCVVHCLLLIVDSFADCKNIIWSHRLEDFVVLWWNIQVLWNVIHIVVSGFPEGTVSCWNISNH
jgi:hypothetical protein